MSDHPTDTRLAQASGGSDFAPVDGARADAAAQRIDRLLFETSLDLIFVVDRQGTFVRVSPSALTILGYEPAEMIGRSATDFLYPDDLESTREEMRHARRGKRTRNFDCRYVHKNGTIVSLAWMGVWEETEQQHFFIGRDMTERNRLEQQLRHSQKMDAIGQLTGGIAHDFNNILSVIIGMTELLRDALVEHPHLLSIAQSIDEAAERGVHLTQRMLAFARKQPLHTRALDLNDIVDRIKKVLERTLGEHIAIQTRLAADLWPALADQSQVEDAILNLAVNARDAMPRGGRLVIETANSHLDEDYVAQNVEAIAGDYVALIVTDTGVGMSQEVVERAFEPFFTTKDVGAGTGLGLSMVYGFAKQLRGHAKIYSEIDHGTSVKIYLPRAEKPAHLGLGDAAMSHDQPPTGGETILVVEDDAAVRAVAIGVLQSLGYKVLEAEDGKAALEILATDQPIDLLFSDMVMPNGIGGLDLFARGRARRPELKVLFTSGYSEHFIEGGNDDGENVPLLSKPYRRQKLAAAVRSALDGTEMV